jgi:hypothetical protein
MIQHIELRISPFCVTLMFWYGIFLSYWLFGTTAVPLVVFAAISKQQRLVNALSYSEGVQACRTPRHVHL